MRQYILQFKYQNILHVFLLSLKSALLVGASATLSLMTNQLASRNSHRFFIWLGVEVGLYLLFLFVTYIIQLHQVRLIQKMSEALRRDYVTKITQSSFHSFQKKDVGDHLSILNNDIQVIENNGFSSLYNLISTVLTTLFSILALLSYDIRIVCLTIILTLILTYLPRPFASKIETIMNKYSSSNEELVSSLNDQLLGYKALYYSHKKHTLLKQIQHIIELYTAQKLTFTKKSAGIETIMTLFSILSQMSILLLTGFLIISGKIAIGTISSVGQISGNIFNSLTTFNQLRMAIISVKPIFLKFEISSDVAGKMLTSEINTIKFENVGYQFNEKEVFSHLYVDIKKGGKYAIVGESGSGKSTFINIILGNLKDYSGKVTCNHLEINALDAYSIISRLSYIGNHTHVYKDTLRNNLTLWEQSVTDNDIQHVLQSLNLMELWDRLDEIIDENLLSEGQKQRLGIARAYLGGNTFFILDEATSNLDKKNARLIEHSLLSNPDITYITVTHHLEEESKHRFDTIIHLGEDYAPHP